MVVKRTSLSIAAGRPEPEPVPEIVTPASETTPIASKARPARAKKAASAPAKQGGSRYAGTCHVGASYDENDDTVEGFRMLVAKTRRSSKDLLHEAMQLLVAKYDRYKPPSS